MGETKQMKYKNARYCYRCVIRDEDDGTAFIWVYADHRHEVSKEARRFLRDGIRVMKIEDELTIDLWKK